MDLHTQIKSIEKNKVTIKAYRLVPTLERLPEVMAFVDHILEQAQMPMKAVSQIDVAVEEIYVNIAHYSGASIAVLSCDLQEDRVVLQFCDDGKPFDPTKRADPDINLPADEREIGGLGIFMVKKMMDEVSYEYLNGRNVLTVVKRR